jgi:tetratricopeptide (TPR) repeat protein
MSIKIRYGFVFFLILAVTSIPGYNLHSRTIQQKPLRQTALENFEAGSYEQAYKDYSTLLQNFPKDPQYKYYSGLCLINLKREPVRAMSLLQEAVNESTDIRKVSDDAWFYLGRSQQMAGRFSEAIRSYEHFSDLAGKKVARDLKVSEFLQECRAGRGQIDEAEKLIADTVMDTGDTLVPDRKDIPVAKTAEKPGDKQVPVKENLPAEYDRTLTQALDFQVKADSLTSLATEMKYEYEKLPASQKPSAKARIDDLESEARRYQRLADEKFSTTGHRTSPGEEIVKKSGQEPAKKMSENIPSDIAKKNDEIAVTSDKPVAVPETKAVFSLFDIVTDPKIINSQKIAIDPVLPQGLIFRIQIAVFSKPVTTSLFKGITPVSGFRVPGTNTVKYYAGMFRKSEDADKALLRVKQMGFRDAFLNAVSDGKIVSIDRALLLEKEWGNRTLFPPAVTAGTSTADTGPATLTFRVEVYRSVKPVKEEITENYRKLAGPRGLEILSTEDGSLVYLIGKFITFESASEYANLLVRNGYREARVTAYLGNKEIPVETATQLFEKIK